MNRFLQCVHRFCHKNIALLEFFEGEHDAIRYNKRS